MIAVGHLLVIRYVLPGGDVYNFLWECSVPWAPHTQIVLIRRTMHSDAHTAAVEKHIHFSLYPHIEHVLDDSAFPRALLRAICNRC